MNKTHCAVKFAVLSLLLVVFTSASCTNISPSPATPVQPSDNEPPVISDVSFAEDVMALTENLITCIAADPDGDDLGYIWSAQGGTIRGEGAGIFWVAPDSVGNYDTKVVVSDNRGGEASKTITIRVVTNADGSTNPLVTLKLSFSSSDPVVETGRARIWTTTDILCQVDGVSATGLKYTWTATEGRMQGKGLAEGTADRVRWIAPGAAGDYTVTVTATDSTGRVTTGQVHFTVFCCTDT